MKSVLYFVVIGVFVASCGHTQQPTDNSSQAKIDSMSQALTRQHIIDSMNAANTASSTPAAAAPTYERRTHESSSYEHHTSRRDEPVNNAMPSEPVPVTPVAPVVNNQVVAPPSAADIAAQKKADHQRELKSAAEGALIGAGAGAIGGAVAGKNKQFKEQDAAIGAGAGAILGAGAGLLIEKHKLKRDSTKAK